MSGSGGAPIREGDDILIVCSANVCRSPLAAFTLERQLGFISADEFRVHSAGTKATAGASMCPVTAGSIEVLDGGVEFSNRHRSCAVDRELVAGAGLVLTATVRQRSAIANLYPPVRRHIFTQHEALALLADAPSAGERELLNDPSLSFVSRIARHLDSRRGTVLPHVKEHGYRSHKPHPWDIADGHSGTRGAHRRAVLITASITTQIGQRLELLAGVRSGI